MSLVTLLAEEQRQSEDNGLQYGFYQETCPEAERIIASTMKNIFSQDKAISAQLLHLLFHDCFVQGCDASVLLEDSNGNQNHTERDAVPNQTLKGFDKINLIKEEIERACPEVVSCADILAVATRDGVLLAGGPFYPVITGRRDSTRSLYMSVLSSIPPPDGNVSVTLCLFEQKGFNEAETVTLLGAHNIGKIGCEFIQPRLTNFMETGEPAPSIPSDFLNDLRGSCMNSNNRRRTTSPGFTTHYYQSLVRGRALLVADQQLMANEMTARVVVGYTLLLMTGWLPSGWTLLVLW